MRDDYEELGRSFDFQIKQLLGQPPVTYPFRIKAGRGHCNDHYNICDAAK